MDPDIRGGKASVGDTVNPLVSGKRPRYQNFAVVRYHGMEMCNPGAQSDEVEEKAISLQIANCPAASRHSLHQSHELANLLIG